MENNLAEINALLGVIGSFVCDGDGKVVSRSLPDTYGDDQLSLTSRVVAQTLQALEVSGQRVTDMDLHFEGCRLILKNLRGGTLAILCARNINLPLLNMTASVAAKKIASQLKTKAAATPASAAPAGKAVAVPAPATPAPTPAGPAPSAPAVPPAASYTPAPAAPTVDDSAAVTAPTVPAVPATHVEPATLAAREELLAPPLFQELYQEACRIMGESKSYRVDLRVMDSLAFWVSTARSRWLLAPIEKREIILGGRLSHAGPIITLLQGLGYEENRRFNALYGKQRLHFLMASRDLSIDVFLDNYAMYHRIDLSGYLGNGAMALVETPLFLSRLQCVEIGDAGLRDLCALLIEHDLSAVPADGRIDTAAITRLCTEDWGWYKTVSVNLDRIHSFATATLSPSDRAIVQERVQRIQQGIASAPKSLRWQTRARVGESVRWYETPMVGHPVGRPDMALG